MELENVWGRMQSLLTLNEFKDPEVGQGFLTKGELITPLGCKLIVDESEASQASQCRKTANIREQIIGQWESREFTC